jgi:hypothetical protein
VALVCTMLLSGDTMYIHILGPGMSSERKRGKKSCTAKSVKYYRIDALFKRPSAFHRSCTWFVLVTKKLGTKNAELMIANLHDNCCNIMYITHVKYIPNKSK